MAFDFGSIDLGLRNPFKTEGKVNALTGAIRLLIGIGLLLFAASRVKEDVVAGWIFVGAGLVVLATGIAMLGGGIYANLRYFVGRNHPTSLAYNHSETESDTARAERPYVAYKNETLEAMLRGRKNPTFVEPIGFLARLLHSLLPKLLQMPYPIRNMTQKVFGAWVKTAVALVAYLLVAFVTLAGFVGDTGAVIFPIYSVVLAVYVLAVWFSVGYNMLRRPQTQIDSLGSRNLVAVIAVSIVLPVIIGVLYSALQQGGLLADAQWQQLLTLVDQLHPLGYLSLTLLLAGASTVVTFLMLQRRLDHAESRVEVSELRENWQESIHPKEIFINLENLVMANRRYKEVPNRVYRDSVPNLNEHVDGKGSFSGVLVQEVQPKVAPMALGERFNMLRFAALVAGNVLRLTKTTMVVWLAFAIVAMATAAGTAIGVGGGLSQVLNLLIFIVLLQAFAGFLAGAAHLFYAEIQFSSLMIYFHCDGTFTESKMSTGTSIYDSTRSENTLVRSSITPWVIVSRLVTSTFAATGVRNLEFPRYVLEMHKAPEELQSIRNDVIGFLKDRESIAAITNPRDLGNTTQIHQLNEQTRATVAPTAQIEQGAEAAGYLRAEQGSKDGEG